MFYILLVTAFILGVLVIRDMHFHPHNERHPLGVLLLRGHIPWGKKIKEINLFILTLQRTTILIILHAVV